MYDVVIIGAGVVGGLIARALSAFELRICIVEKENDVAMGTTKANSAIVHAGLMRRGKPEGEAECARIGADAAGRKRAWSKIQEKRIAGAWIL